MSKHETKRAEIQLEPYQERAEQIRRGRQNRGLSTPEVVFDLGDGFKITLAYYGNMWILVQMGEIARDFAVAKPSRRS